jgi:hypothetical protein
VDATEGTGLVLENHRAAAVASREPVDGWTQGKKKDGTPDKYFQTNGTHNVCAICIDGVWWFEAWQLTPRIRLGMWRTAAEAKAQCES